MKINHYFRFLLCATISITGAVASGQPDLSELPQRMNGTNHLKIDPRATDQQIQVAIIDSGFDVYHPLIKDRLLEGLNCRDITPDIMASIVVAPDRADFGKLTSHGTHVTGIVTQLTPPSVQIYPYKFGAAGNRQWYSSLIALDHLKEHNKAVKVLNMSFSIENYLYDKDHRKQTFDALVEVSKNTLVTISAGNEKEEYGLKDQEFLLDLLKAGKGNIIIVGASYYDASSDQQRERFDRKYSNTAGKFADYFITAPGTGVKSSVPMADNPLHYQAFNGTSMAAPVVAGALANIIARTGVTIEQAREAIFSTAKLQYYKGYELPRAIYGKGVLDFDAAFQAALDMKNTPKMDGLRQFWADLKFFPDVPVIEAVGSYKLGTDEIMPVKLLKGFCGAEISHRWAEGFESALSIPNSLVKTLYVQFKDTQAHLNASCPEQMMQVFVNDNLQGTYRYNLARNQQSILLEIPADRYRPDAFVTFKTPNAHSPAALDPMGDPRVLSVLFRDMIVSYDNPLLGLPGTYNLGTDDDKPVTFLSGFCGAETTHRWAEGRDSVLSIMNPLSKTLYVEFKDTQMYLNELCREQLVYIFANNKFKGTYRYDLAHKMQSLFLEIPADPTRSETIVRFMAPKAHSPAALDPKGDPRVLSLLFRDMILSYDKPRN